MRNLIAAAGTFPNTDALVAEGLEQLQVHRGNYTATHPDPQKLQILWWEFPQEHWVELREGSYMNFLFEPKEGISPNAKMDDEQLAVAAAFMDELISLGALEECPPENLFTARVHYSASQNLDNQVSGG